MFSVHFTDNSSAGAHPFQLHIDSTLNPLNTGTRGATSAEYFLKSGYAVIDNSVFNHSVDTTLIQPTPFSIFSTSNQP